MSRLLPYLLFSCISVSAFAGANLILFTDARNTQFVEPGTTATYIANVRNHGSEPAQNVLLRMPFPAGSKFLSVDTSVGWTCSGNDAEVVCTATQIPPMPGAEASWRVSASVVLSSDPNGFVANSLATVTSNTIDDIPSNNQSGISTIVYRMLRVTSTADSGPASLRAGIEEANSRCADAVRVPCKMTLDLPPYSTIEPLTPLPAIQRGALRIDGNRLRDGDRRIELSGVHLTRGNGLEIRSGAVLNEPLFIEIFGLAINSFPDYGVATTGNGDATVYLDGLFIGTDVTGTVARPNGRGIGLFAPRMQINAGQNVISGNVHSGIFALTSSTTWLSNSLIGVGTDGRALGNGNSGVFIYRGGIDIGSCTIANSSQFGVSIAPEATRASLFNTRIYSNGILGIDWGLDGPSTGLAARHIPDPPSIADAIYDVDKDETAITGTFDRASALGSLIYVEVFANSTRDAQGHAEGERVIARVSPNGLTFNARVKGDLRGQIITTTLNVGPYLDGVPTLTSEFSEGVVVR